MILWREGRLLTGSVVGLNGITCPFQEHSLGGCATLGIVGPTETAQRKGQAGLWGAGSLQSHSHGFS